MKLHRNEIAIIAVAMAMFMIVPILAIANNCTICNTTNTTNVYNITNITNVYNITNITAYKFNCTLYYNKTEVDTLINNALENCTLLAEELEARTLWNFSQLDSKIGNISTAAINATIDSKLNVLEGRTDSKFENLQDKYVSKEELDNKTASNNNKLLAQVNSIMDKKGDVSQYFTWLFWIAIAAIVGAVAIKMYKPSLFKPLKGVKGMQHTVEELTTASELRDMRDKMIALKTKIVEKKIDKKLKVELARKVDSGEIKEESDIERHLKILKELS